MDRDDRLNDNQPADGPAGSGAFDNAAGAFLLDALSDEERSEFQGLLQHDPELQAEVAHLRPVIGVLPLALDGANQPRPSAGLRSRILQAARDESEAALIGGDSVGTPPTPPSATRPRPAPTAATRQASPQVGTILPLVRRIRAERLVAGLLAIVAAGALIWGLSLQSRLNETRDDLDAARDELAAFQAGGNGVVQAVVYTLDPTEDGPETANAIVSMPTEDAPEATISALGLPPTAEGRAYQLWFLNLTDAGDVEGTPRPSVTFQVGADGAAIVDGVPVDGPFDAVAITDEPASGSPAPSTAPLLFGTRGVAAG